MIMSLKMKIWHECSEWSHISLRNLTTLATGGSKAQEQIPNGNDIYGPGPSLFSLIDVDYDDLKHDLEARDFGQEEELEFQDSEPEFYSWCFSFTVLGFYFGLCFILVFWFVFYTWFVVLTLDILRYQ